MIRFHKYRDFSEGTTDKDGQKDSEETDDYNKVTRFGIDDPAPAKILVEDLRTRMNMLHIIMVAYEIPPKAFNDYLEMLYAIEMGTTSPVQPY